MGVPLIERISKQKFHAEDLEKLCEAASHQEHQAQKYDNRQKSGEYALESRLKQERRTDERTGRSNQLHGMDGEPAGIYVKSDGIVDQHKGYEQQERNKHAEHG